MTFTPELLALLLSRTHQCHTHVQYPHRSLQFLVVSHKDGFFNNANIIYRTKFVDGVSAVTRTVVQHADRVASGAVHGAELAGLPQGKATAAARGGGGEAGGRPRGALKDSNR